MNLSMIKKPELSIVILSYNTRKLLADCLQSLKKVEREVAFEIIVIDNGSTDGSPDVVSREFPGVKLIRNRKNLGFARGNNKAKDIARGEYILFLNSDTIVPRGTLRKTLGYIARRKGIGALTCKTILPDGNLDRDARRSFPTPWVAFSHFFGLDRLFPDSELFSKYWYGFRSPNEIQEVEVLQGAFFLAKKEILDRVGWFSEEYFLDGEDIDLCWKIIKAGHKIIYYPDSSITHIKGASKGKIRRSLGKVTKEEQIKFIHAGLDSMEMFYKKWLWDKYPLPLNWLVILGINILRFLRYLKAIAT